MKPQVITEFQKNATETLRISIVDFKGRTNLDIRSHYEDQQTGELKPTTKGITFYIDTPEDREKLDLLVQALIKAKGILAKGTG